MTTALALASGIALAPLAASFAAPIAAPSANSVPQFDIGDLPPYKPGHKDESGHCHGAVCSGVWGVIRISGTELTQHLVHLWQDNFLKLHPNIRYGDYFVPSAFAGLVSETADISVVGHSAWHSDLKSFEGAFGYDPLEIMFATGGFNLGKGNTPAAIIFVNKDNPLPGLTIKQLDGIFGAERSGGWKGAKWSTESARGAADNLRTWGQLGLTGEWADQPIRLYGLDATLSNWSELIQRVAFKGGDKWNPAMKEIVRGGTEIPADAQIVQAVAEDKYAIGFNLMRVVEKEPRVKALALAAEAGGPFVAPGNDSIFRRTYPLSNAVFPYINRPPGKALSPRLKEFLSYILSREGQQDVVNDGMFIPLNPDTAAEQRRKLQ